MTGVPPPVASKRRSRSVFSSIFSSSKSQRLAPSHVAFDAISLPAQRSDPAFSSDPSVHYAQRTDPFNAMPIPTGSPDSSLQMSSQSSLALLSVESVSSFTTPSSSSSMTPVFPPLSPPPDYEFEHRPSPSRNDSAPELRHIEPPGLGRRPQTAPPPNPSRRRQPHDLDRIDELDESNPLGVALHHQGPFEAVASMLKTPESADIPQRHARARNAHAASLGVSPGEVLPPNFFPHHPRVVNPGPQPYRGQVPGLPAHVVPQIQYAAVEDPYHANWPPWEHALPPSEEFSTAYGGIAEDEREPPIAPMPPQNSFHPQFNPAGPSTLHPRILRDHDPNVPPSRPSGHARPTEHDRIRQPQPQQVPYYHDPRPPVSPPPPAPQPNNLRPSQDYPATIASSIASSTARRLPHHLPKNLVMPTPLQQTSQLPSSTAPPIHQVRFEAPPRAQTIQMVQDRDGGRHLLRKRSSVQQPVAPVMPPKPRAPPRPLSYMEPPPTIPMAPIARLPEQNKKRPKRLLSKRRTDL
ncbi:hypothetical protein C8F01DRAFT_421415 [Mycena amicta]|nr:hypothetical protein C8F01DRAFT_421415 [Mycena amicta]